MYSEITAVLNRYPNYVFSFPAEYRDYFVMRDIPFFHNKENDRVYVQS